jgi:cysteine-rich repeat protein
LLVGCTVGDPGTGGGDDDGGAVCGDGVKEGAEVCDDGNTAGGDGCSATCTEEAAPRLDVVLDKQLIDTELMTTHMITVTLGAAGGFSGAVNLTASVVDSANNPIPGWTVTLDSATVNIPVDGGGQAIATLTVPSTNKGLSGTVKIDATSSLGTAQVTSMVTAANQITIPMTLNNGQCVYPAAGTINITVGSKLRFVNKAASNVTIHMGPEINGLQHQPNPGSAPNGVYEQTITGTPAGTIGWYCHAPGPTVNNLRLQPVAP